MSLRGGVAVQYIDMLKNNLDETDIRMLLVSGDQVAITVRIPESLRDATKEAAEMRGVSFSAFIRMSMIEELAKGISNG